MSFFPTHRPTAWACLIAGTATFLAAMAAGADTPGFAAMSLALAAAGAVGLNQTLPDDKADR